MQSMLNDTVTLNNTVYIKWCILHSMKQSTLNDTVKCTLNDTVYIKWYSPH
jgi:hypothetical protein